MKLLRTAAAVAAVAVALTGAVAVHRGLAPAGATALTAGPSNATATNRTAVTQSATTDPATTRPGSTPVTATRSTAPSSTATQSSTPQPVTTAAAGSLVTGTTTGPAAAPTTAAPVATPPTPATAQAVTPGPAATVPAPSAAPSVIGALALAKISYPWTKLGYQLTFHGPKDGFYGLTNCTTHQIDIYITPSQTVTQVAYITAFEIAHAVDCVYISAARQAEWPVLRGYQLHGPWFPDCSCSENAFSSGDFAEVFARWQVGAVYPWRSILAPAPTAAQIAALVPFLEG